MKKLLLSTALCFMLIFSVFSLNACTNATEDHKITVTFSNGQYGTASGSGTFKTNSTVTIRANASNDHIFLGWIKNDLIVSREPVYSFIASKQTEGKYIAFFSTDALEFFKISEINYEINGLDLSQSAAQLNYITSIKIKCGTTSELLKNLGDAPNEEMSNTGNFQTSNFQFDERIFDITKLYYFSAEFNYEYLNIETGTTSTGVLNSNFNVNFNLLKNGTINDNITTYVGSNYTLIQTYENSVYTVEISEIKLENLANWNEEASHCLSMKFIYPFDADVEDEQEGGEI